MDQEIKTKEKIRRRRIINQESKGDAMKNIMLICLVGVVLCFVGCTDKADLVAETQSIGFCEVDETGSLVVNVKNQGEVAALSSVTKVEFPGIAGFEIPTGALDPAQVISLKVSIPVGCFNPDCSFRIIVDYLNEVGEKDENNNETAGHCVG